MQPEQMIAAMHNDEIIVLTQQQTVDLDEYMSDNSVDPDDYRITCIVVDSKFKYEVGLA